MPLLLLRRFWWAIPIALLFAALLITRSTLEKRTDRLRATEAAYAQFQADVKAKTELARLQDAQNKARVERDQVQVSQEVSSEYQAKLADLRRRYDALRLQRPAQANSSGSRGPAVPRVPDAASGADAGSGEAGLPLTDALIASEQALQLQALQDWVRGQTAVDR